MRQSTFVRWAPPLGALITAVVGYAWCAAVLEWSPWPSLGAGLGGAVPVFAALRLAAHRGGSGRDARGRVLGLMTLAGFLMLAAGLLALLLPGVERGGLVGAVGLFGAALYFGAVLYEVWRGRKRGD